jgi:hypothetical protein
MTLVRTRRRFALGSLLVAAGLVACGPKEQAPPPVTTAPAPPSAAPVTTTTTTTTLPPPPPAVWRAARWGMTKAQVLAAFPGEAQRLAQPVAFGTPSGASTDVAIPACEVAGTSFRVLFGFTSVALDRIQLSAIKPADSVCGDLEKDLTEKHSAPSDRHTTQTTVRSEEVVWKGPDQTITLTCSENAALGYRSVTLDYATGTPH